MANSAIKIVRPSYKDDPISYLTTKFKSLNNTLTELLTKDYKSYITGIYVVAPKPTTFKVVLHNNQEVILTYLGRAYDCKVQGKKYYLGNYSEKVGAINAIAQTLELGQPFEYKTGEASPPEGPPEETTSTPSEEETPEVPAEETPAETLAESILRRTVIRIVK